MYLQGERNYSNLVGTTGPVAYPAACVYLYAFLSKISNHYTSWLVWTDSKPELPPGLRFEDKLPNHMMQNMHILIDALRIYITAKIYKKAYGKSIEGRKWILLMLILQTKLKFLGVIHAFNDAIMSLLLVCSIYLAVQVKPIASQVFLSVVLLGVAINVKMAALLIVPGYMICIAYLMGIRFAIFSILIIVIIQVLFGLEFMLINKESYLNMAYNFSRSF